MNTARTLIKSILETTDESLKKLVGNELVLKGWIRTKRDSKNCSFLELNDGTTIHNLQIVVDQTEGTEDLLEQCHTGVAIEVSGKLIKSLGKGQKVELSCSKLNIVGPCDPEIYPLQKKRHTNEFLRTIGHLRPRTNTFGAVFRLRSVAAFAIHKFFQEQNFVYLHTPIITTSDCEGAGQMFRVTTLDLLKPPLNDKKQIDYHQDFFGGEASLTVSGQLEAEAFACSLSNVYTFGPTFRAENSNTPRHLAEFWMVEPEMAFCDLSGNAALAEAFLKSVIGHILAHAQSDMEFFDSWVEKGIVKSLESVCASAFERMTYTDAIKALESSSKKFEFPVQWGLDLQTEHERYLTEEHVGRPVFITNYPKEIKAFYMRLDESGKTVSAMDLLVPRLGEIIGGAQREERHDVLREKLISNNLDPEEYHWYLDLRRFGSVPHAGFGLGFERLLMYVSGISNIRDVIPFARYPGHATVATHRL